MSKGHDALIKVITQNGNILEVLLNPLQAKFLRENINI